MPNKINVFIATIALVLLPATAKAATPSIAFNGSSYGIVEVQTFNGTSSVVFSRVSADGKKQQPDAIVTTASSLIRFPTLHWTGLNYLVFWTQVDGNGTLINARRIDGVGKPVTAIIHIHRIEVPIASFESVIVEQSPHHFVLTWEETLGKDHSRSMLLRVDTAGAKLMEPVIVSESGPTPPPAPIVVLQPGPTNERLQQVFGTTPSSGTPPYPTQPSLEAHSITSLPQLPAYGFLTPTRIPLALPSPFQPQTAQAAPQEAFYPFSPAPTFGHGTPSAQVQARTDAATTPAISQSTPSQQASVSTQLLVQAGDLIRGSTPSVWRYGEDGKRHLYPDDFTFKSWSNQYDWVSTVSDAQIQSIPEGNPILIYPGYAIVAFTGDANFYTATRVGVLKKLNGSADAKAKYGANWKKRVHVYPAGLKAQYTFETVKPKSAAPKKPAARRATQTVVPRTTAQKPAVQPKNLRSRNVL